MLRLERERVVEVRFQIGGALAGNPVDEIERDVVKLGITKMMHGASDVVRTGNTFEHLQELRSEALRAERHPRDPGAAQSNGKLGRHRLGIRLDRHLQRGRQRLEQPHEVGQGRERRRAAPEEDRLELARESAALELELPQQRVDVRRVLTRAADDGDEVAVAAAVRAERQVHVQVACAAAVHQLFPCWPMLSTARNASCGTSTMPTCFIRFLPFFCFSSSLRLREMSPP